MLWNFEKFLVGRDGTVLQRFSPDTAPDSTPPCSPPSKPPWPKPDEHAPYPAGTGRQADVCQPTGSAELAMLDVVHADDGIGRHRLRRPARPVRGPGRTALDTQTLAKRFRPAPAAPASWPTSWSPLVIWKSTASSLPTPPAPSELVNPPARRVDYTPACHGPSKHRRCMGDLAAAVRRGEPEKTLWQAMEERPQLGKTFSAYMDAFAGDLGPDLLAHVPVAPHHTRLLDLGGSHGACTGYPLLPALSAARRADRRPAQRADRNRCHHRPPRPGRAHPRQPRRAAGGPLARPARRGVLPVGRPQPQRR